MSADLDCEPISLDEDTAETMASPTERAHGWEPLNPECSDDIFMRLALRRLRRVETEIAEQRAAANAELAAVTDEIEAHCTMRTAGRAGYAFQLRAAIDDRITHIQATTGVATVNTPAGTVHIHTAPKWEWPTRVDPKRQLCDVLAGIDKALFVREKVELSPVADAVKLAAQIDPDGVVRIDGETLPHLTAADVTTVTITFPTDDRDSF